MIGAGGGEEYGADEKAKALPWSCLQVAGPGEELNQWKVKDIDAVGEVAIFSPVTQIRQAEGKRDDGNGQGDGVQGREKTRSLQGQKKQAGDEDFPPMLFEKRKIEVDAPAAKKKGQLPGKLLFQFEIDLQAVCVKEVEKESGVSD